MDEKVKDHRKLAAIMFTDMVGYSSLAQRNESLALALLDEHRRILRSLFPKNNGKEIETAGDAFFVEFASALEAVQCATQIQETLFSRNDSVAEEKRIIIRIGVHLGDVVVRGNSVLGDGVNIAARIEPLAEPAGICISEDVARQVRNKIELPLQKLGSAQLKNIQLPMDVYAIELPWMEKPAPTDVGVRKKKGKISPNKKAIYLGAALLTILVGVVLLYQIFLYAPPRPVGYVALNILPWAEITKITNDKGEEVNGFSQGNDKIVTPYRLSLPAGNYTIYLSNPVLNKSLEIPIWVKKEQFQEIKRKIPGFDYNKILSSLE